MAERCFFLSLVAFGCPSSEALRVHCRAELCVLTLHHSFPDLRQALMAGETWEQKCPPNGLGLARPRGRDAASGSGALALFWARPSLDGLAGFTIPRGRGLGEPLITGPHQVAVTGVHAPGSQPSPYAATLGRMKWMEPSLPARWRSRTRWIHHLAVTSPHTPHTLPLPLRPSVFPACR